MEAVDFRPLNYLHCRQYFLLQPNLLPRLHRPTIIRRRFLQESLSTNKVTPTRSRPEGQCTFTLHPRLSQSTILVLCNPLACSFLGICIILLCLEIIYKLLTLPRWQASSIPLLVNLCSPFHDRAVASRFECRPMSRTERVKQIAARQD